MDEAVEKYTPEQAGVLLSVEELAGLYNYDPAHSAQVTWLALRLFDELHDLHSLGVEERFFLECAAILHDIGLVEGYRGHHKATLNIILRTTLLPLENRERLVIGSIARYHTRALPSADHDHFAALQADDQASVLRLSAILRLADGLDRSHRAVIRDIRCQVDMKAIQVLYSAAGRAKDDEKGAKLRKDLLEKVFRRELSVRWDQAVPD